MRRSRGVGRRIDRGGYTGLLATLRGVTTPDPLPELLAPFLEHPDQAGVFTDFDGTLSPIVDDPASAAALPEALTALARLADRYARVGVISGRPVDALAERLGARLVDRLLLSGLYGLEILDRGRRHDESGALAWRDTVLDAANRAEAELPNDVPVERKGLSLTLHFRTAPGRESAVAEWAQREAKRSGLSVRPARRSIELHPPVETDKGTALTAAAAGLAAVCFCGDDAGDLPAFAALHHLAEDGVRILRVGVRSEEAPAELEHAVDILVDGPPGVVALLDRLSPQPRSDR